MPKDTLIFGIHLHVHVYLGMCVKTIRENPSMCVKLIKENFSMCVKPIKENLSMFVKAIKDCTVQ